MLGALPSAVEGEPSAAAPQEAEAAAPADVADDAAQAELRSAHEGAVRQVVERSLAAFESRDFARAFDLVPPAILAPDANSGGPSAAEVRAQAVEAFELAMQSVTYEEKTLDVDAARYGQTDAGRAYAVVPTSATFSFEGGRIRNDAAFLALNDGDTWYLAPVSELEEVLSLRAAYPDFVEVEFLPGTVEVLE